MTVCARKIFLTRGCRYIPEGSRRCKICPFPCPDRLLRDPLFPQGHAKTHQGRDIRQAPAGGFGEKRHSPGGSGVDLDDIDPVIAVHDELDVKKPSDPDPQAQPLRVVQNQVPDRRGKAVGGIDADGIAGVYAGPLDQFHNAGDENIDAVADRVHFHFFAPYILVHKDRLVGVDLNGSLKIFVQFFLLADDLHGAAAQDKAGPHQDGVADLSGGPDPRLNRRDRMPFGLRDLQLLQKLFKAVPVFRPLDGVAVCADDPDAPLVKGLRQVDGCLSAKGRNDAPGLFHRDHIHHVLDGQRLEIEFVGAGVVRGHRLRIVIDNDRLITCPADSLDRMNRRVIEFHALADPDRSRSQDYDFSEAAAGKILLPEISFPVFGSNASVL